MVANCHVHWDPEYSDVKLIQAMMLMHKLNDIAISSAKHLRPDLPDHKISGNSIPLVMCGDLNSKPDSGVIEFLRSGNVSANHSDFKDIGYKNCLKKLSHSNTKGVYSHQLSLDLAYNKENMPYTNYTLV